MRRTWRSKSRAHLHVLLHVAAWTRAVRKGDVAGERERRRRRTQERKDGSDHATVDPSMREMEQRATTDVVVELRWDPTSIHVVDVSCDRIRGWDDLERGRRRARGGIHRRVPRAEEERRRRPERDGRTGGE